MIIIISGATHTGKTAFAQRLLEKYKIPYLSLDHLKMGLIRSGNTTLTPEDDSLLTAYLWPIAREMIKTAVENRQSLIVEGCYVPFDWKKDLGDEYLKDIRCLWLIMTKEYIEKHYQDIMDYENVVESRIDDGGCTPGVLIRDNAENLLMCQKHGCEYILIEDEYSVELPKV